MAKSVCGSSYCRKMGILAAALLLTVACPPTAIPQTARGDAPAVVLDTTLGKIMIELYPDKAPGTVKSFLQYVDDRFYDGLIFHRVIADFMMSRIPCAARP
ncbi:MAG: peptidylprolyl isomerase [Gemmataceae bacterium]|nr:peptidylprolyl isomerase [Gemmataceae bacterium]MCI0740716.1 peptidylprolyl isomerase [Gemmataceae bacterium]